MKARLQLMSAAQLTAPEERRLDDGFHLHARLMIDPVREPCYPRAGRKGSICLAEKPCE